MTTAPVRVKRAGAVAVGQEMVAPPSTGRIVPVT